MSDIASEGVRPALAVAPAPPARRRELSKLLLVSHSTLMYIFLYAPIVILVLYSFNAATFGATSATGTPSAAGLLAAGGSTGTGWADRLGTNVAS